MSSSPNDLARFLLVLSTESDLLRAALVNRKLHIVASAQQQFEMLESPEGHPSFNRDEVWYKTKRVIAACLDIGRTQTHETAGLAIVTEAAGTRILVDADEEWTMESWLVHNLTGNRAAGDSGEFLSTVARSPFDAPRRVVAVVNWADAAKSASDLDVSGADRAILGTARRAWQALEKQKANG